MCPLTEIWFKIGTLRLHWNYPCTWEVHGLSLYCMVSFYLLSRVIQRCKWAVRLPKRLFHMNQVKSLLSKHIQLIGLFICLPRYAQAHLKSYYSPYRSKSKVTNTNALYANVRRPQSHNTHLESRTNTVNSNTINFLMALFHGRKICMNIQLHMLFSRLYMKIWRKQMQKLKILFLTDGKHQCTDNWYSWSKHQQSIYFISK